MNHPPRNTSHSLYICLAALALTLFMLVSCSKETNQQGGVAEPMSAGDCLVQTVAVDALEQTGDLRTFVGDSLWEYINGGAELYHQYGFEEVATADYRLGSEEFVADIYRFASEDGAFGLYASLRPDEPVVASYGIEGFSSPSSTVFVKGRFVVQLTAYSATDSSALGQSFLAGALADCLEGTTSLPKPFDLLPKDSSQPNSEKFYMLSYQGRAFLNDFYTRKYIINSDTVTLLVSVTDAAAKFEEWKAAVTLDENLTASAVTLPFENGSVVVAETYYGPMLFGLDGSHLIGMINYSPKQTAFIKTWISSSQ